MPGPEQEAPAKQAGAAGEKGAEPEQPRKTTNAPVPAECHTKGKHAFTVKGVRFEVDRKYAPVKCIGKGAYGVVCSAKNTLTGEKVAIKRIQNVFENLIDARRALREVVLLRHLPHENIIKVLDIDRPPERETFNELYVVYELLDADLHQIIHSPQALTDEHNQYFIYQILRGLKYIHSANVLHRDLKPGNLLLNASCDLRICDFGLARTSAEQAFMTEYVVTRYYRAPELLLACEQYTAAIDMWSVGCIFAELLGRTPLFPGKDYLDQLTRIVSTLGSPSADDMHFISHKRAKRFIMALTHSPGVDWAPQFPDATPEALDLLQKMLRFDPAKRITVEDALEHPYLAALHDPSCEPSCPNAFAFDFEEQELDERALRLKLWDEIEHYNPFPIR